MIMSSLRRMRRRALYSPKGLAAKVKLAQMDRLAPAIKAVLREAVKAGGSSLRDHKRVDGELGYFQKSFAVYDREATLCATTNCSGVIKRIVQSGRSTFYCPVCQ